MTINIGENKEKSLAEIMLKNPKNVKWVLGQSDAEGALKKICEEIKRLIRIFDSKPFTKQCGGHNCHNLATRCTAYEDNFTALKWWCDNCDPYQSGVHPGALHIIRTYEDVLRYVNSVCRDRKTDYEAFIKKLAQEKGLPRRANKSDINKCFL